MTSLPRVRWWREPLLHFVLIGGALYAADAALRPRDVESAPHIVLPPSVRQGSPEQRQQYVEEEALYREAVRLGLGDGDLIVRRRLVQKMEFLLEDAVSPATPTEADLETWLAADAARYEVPRRVTFEHVYFSRDRRGAAAEADARAALSSSTPAGDPFLSGRRFEQRAESDLVRNFGRDFATAVGALTPGGWHGPIASAYGFHLVRVEAVTPARPAQLAEVRARVAADWTEARRREAGAEARRQLIDRYRVAENP